MAHDAVKKDVARIAVVGDSCHPAIPKETFEALFERPIYIRVGGVVGTQELVREDINIGVGQHSTSPLAIVMSLSFSGCQSARIEATLIPSFRPAARLHRVQSHHGSRSVVTRRAHCHLTRKDHQSLK